MIELFHHDIANLGEGRCTVSLHTRITQSIADMTRHVGQNDTPSRRFAMLAITVDADIESTVKSLLCDPNARHFDRSSILKGCRWN
ncbi:hypothetical protein D3C85_1512570 [compost metagenome]